MQPNSWSSTSIDALETQSADALEMIVSLNAQQFVIGISCVNQVNSKS